MGIKALKTKYVIEGATKLFLKRSIGEVTIKDIASEMEIGEATVYRYFVNKKNIVTQSALMLQESVFCQYFNLSGVSGYDRISEFYGSYLKVFYDHAEYYKFISEFDAYMLQEDRDRLDEYSDGLDLFKREFLEAYNIGVKDGSVREIDDIETFYYATTHALLGLCKKLAVNIDIVRQDGVIDKDIEIKKLIDVILYNVKNPRV